MNQTTSGLERAKQLRDTFDVLWELAVAKRDAYRETGDSREAAAVIELIAAASIVLELAGLEVKA